MKLKISDCMHCVDRPAAFSFRIIIFIVDTL